MSLLWSVRLYLARRIPFRRRPVSASSVKLLLADIHWRLRHMDPTPDAQAIIDQINKLPGAISAEVASEVAAAEAAKDAQYAANIAGIQSALTSVSNGIGTQPGA